jgi:exopolysaccharide biosynthesis polyprenyl glycosylphosphotransferase
MGFLDANHYGDPRVLGKTEDLARVARQEFIDEVFVTIPSERELVKKIVLQARHLNLNVKVVPELYDGLAWLSPVEFVGDFPVRVLHREPIPGFRLFLKRLTDIIGSAFGLVLLSPILGLIALAIRLDSPGPVFYRANRVGKKGRKFLCYKFRTMVANADEMKQQLRTLNERQGPFFKITADPRITRAGAFLRKYSLDELPQLWNVLKGEMSLVGPRPHPIDDYEQYTLEHLRRLDVTPGITCLWQVSARHDPSFDKALALDSQYIENWSYLLDLSILAKTVAVVLQGTGQ